MYGWLLQEAGRNEEARQWLARAYEFLQQPDHLRVGQLVPRTLPGSRPISRRPEENRLMELLRKDLTVQDDKGDITDI